MCSSDLHRWHAEHVREERTDLLGLGGENDRMQPGDHGTSLAVDGRAMTCAVSAAGRHDGHGTPASMVWSREGAPSHNYLSGPRVNVGLREVSGGLCSSESRRTARPGLIARSRELLLRATAGRALAGSTGWTSC